MNEIEMIKGARELLSDPKRWGKGSSRPNGTAYCVIGALSECNAHKRGEIVEERIGRLQNAVRLVEEHIPSGGERLVSFYNDAPDTTHQDILNLLDKTLADLGGLA
jgi:hypothetical protein